MQCAKYTSLSREKHRCGFRNTPLQAGDACIPDDEKMSNSARGASL